MRGLMRSVIYQQGSRDHASARTRNSGIKCERARVRASGESRRRDARPSGGDRPLVAGIGISHPDRVIYPQLGISKLDLARYFEQIAKWMVLHVEGRPLTLLHCPAGLAGACTFLKHAKA